MRRWIFSIQFSISSPKSTKRLKVRSFVTNTSPCSPPPVCLMSTLDTLSIVFSGMSPFILPYKQKILLEANYALFKHLPQDRHDMWAGCKWGWRTVDSRPFSSCLAYSYTQTFVALWLAKIEIEKKSRQKKQYGRAEYLIINNQYPKKFCFLGNFLCLSCQEGCSFRCMLPLSPNVRPS